MAEDRFEYEHEMRVWEAKLVQKAHVFGVHLSAVCDLAGLALKSIILANSASAGAVLALLAAMWNSPSVGAIAGPAVQAVSVFAAGTFVAMLAAALGYIAQYCYAAADWYFNDSPKRRPLGMLGAACHVVSVAAAIAGIVCFAVGAFQGITALEVARDTFSAAPTLPSPNP